ncbi:MAG TPA: DUF4332 domain-containing protein, partial [Gemmatimonadota bacterium]|nr:DUF4332 domain-containing protein [Gemmatimonadota bacterium]
FEMPVAGFLGFPFFALEAFAAWQALVVAGLSVPAEEREARAHGRTGGPPYAVAAGRGRGAAVNATALAAAAFSAVTIAAMHRKTIASVVPAVADLGAPAAPLDRAGIADPWELAGADPDDLAAALGTEANAARVWVERARLATLRGIGAEGASRLEGTGIASVEELAEGEPESLARRLAEAGEPVPPARVRVWVRAARDAARQR